MTQHGCDCGSTEPGARLDARTIPPIVRHGAILGAVAALPSGASFDLVAPHDPVPLLAQIQAANGGSVTWDYLERGPEWVLRLTRA